jgi:hypothetical protein
MSKHLPALLLIILSTAALYLPWANTYFCGFDDFTAIHRANFEDTNDPAGMFTKTDFGLPKYRPIERALLYLTWHASNGDSSIFRLKNIGFHILAACLLYGVSWLMFGSRSIALGAALLFGLRPQANQPVMASVWIIVPAYASLLGCFFLFLLSLKPQKRWWLPLSGALVLISILLFVYESTIVLFGFMALYLALWILRRRPLPQRYLLFLITASSLILVSFFYIRSRVIDQKPERTPPAVIAKNLALYSFAISTPVDLVLANAWFGTPMPPDLKDRPDLLKTGAALALSLAAIFIFALIYRQGLRLRFLSLPWLDFLFLAVAILMLLSPFLIFSTHASETYIYLSLGIFSILFATTLHRLIASAKIYAAVIVVLLILGAAGVQVRNRYVGAGGAASARLMRELPLNGWRQGSYTIHFAPSPSSAPLRRYGIYGLRGLAAVDPAEPGIDSAEYAIQTFTQNQNLKVDAGKTLDLSLCSLPALCFHVSDEGIPVRVQN